MKKDVSALLRKTALGILVLAVAAPAAQARFTVQLAASLPRGAAVGTRVVWQTTVEDYFGSRPPLFRFEGRLMDDERFKQLARKHEDNLMDKRKFLFQRFS